MLPRRRCRLTPIVPPPSLPPLPTACSPATPAACCPGWSTSTTCELHALVVCGCAAAVVQQTPLHLACVQQALLRSFAYTHNIRCSTAISRTATCTAPPPPAPASGRRAAAAHALLLLGARLGYRPARFSCLTSFQLSYIAGGVPGALSPHAAHPGELHLRARGRRHGSRGVAPPARVPAAAQRGGSRGACL